MRVLVTGSSGFLGHHVADFLSRSPGLEVTGFDLQPAHDARFPTILGDLCNLEDLSAAVRTVSTVVHFGGVGDVDLASRRPDLAALANVVGTTNVAVAARQARASVVYASTWEVYGTPVRDPVDETHPCDPGHIYGATKLAGEQALRAFHRTVGLPVVILRLGTAYGSGMRPNSVFRRFCDAASQGLAIRVDGSGQQWRQFTHASDIARAVRSSLVRDDGELVLNIVSDEATTIRELAELVSNRYQVPVQFGPGRHGDPPPAIVSSFLASQLLGWRAEVKLRDGLAELLADTAVGSVSPSP